MQKQIKFKKRPAKTCQVDSLKKEVSVPTAVHKLFSLLPILGAAIAATSAIGYLLSWNMLEIYYSEIGANWYRKTLQPTTVLLAGMNVYIGIGLSTLFGLTCVMQGATTRKMTITATILGVTAILLQNVSVFAAGRYSALTLTGLSGIGVFLGYVAAGIMLAELVSSLKDSKLAWGASQLILISCLYSSVLMPSIRNSETQKAKTDMDSSFSKLPYAQKRGCADCIWRIVSTDNGKVLLARISTVKTDRKFMLVALDENWEISP